MIDWTSIVAQVAKAMYLNIALILVNLETAIFRALEQHHCRPSLAEA